ncbi:hypothetical protein CEXT_756751 [Caerostris extrusa]|uniref:Uncharacterized protein n=1 Tax=Caerostris extrusa TaxID=172846 RepID=A0AAV4XCM8_CAEEX|nr:hypothetical protein CEXT_756751 [Caerostris extrusa]
MGRRFDRRFGMFTPKSALKRRHVRVRRPLFGEDYVSPEGYPSGAVRRVVTPVRVPPPARAPVTRGSIEWSSPQRARHYSPPKRHMFKSYQTSTFRQ